MSNALRIAFLVATIVGLGAFVASGVRVLDDPEDLRAFYCAGKVVAAQHDPYYAEPLRTCEVRESRAAGLTPYAELAVPAPLPGFAFLPFMTIAWLPFSAVCALYVLLAIGALVATGIMLRELSGASYAVIAAALACADGLASVGNGQIVPFAIAALCAAAMSLKQRRYGWAAVFVALASVEPHVALPAWIGLGLAEVRARRPLAMFATALVAVSLVVLGPEPNLEYVMRVLPAHAASEAAAVGQFSLATLLVRCGVPLAASLATANGWYAAMCAFGVFAGWRLARSLEAPELVVLLPPAFAVFGGPFVHLTQLAFALPAVLVLGSRLPRQRAPFAIALLLLALPWEDLVENPAPAVLVAIVIVALPIALGFWRLRHVEAGAVTLAMLGVGAVELFGHAVLVRSGLDATRAIELADGNRRLAEATWTAFMSVAQTADVRWYLLSHAPTWAGIAIALATALSATRRSRFANS